MPAMLLKLGLDCLALLLDPKVWLLLAVAGLVGMIKGCTDERERHEELMATIERIGKAHQEWSARRTAEQKSITERKDKDHAKKLEVLTAANGDLQRRLRAAAGRSIVPAVPGSPAGGEAGGGVVCFSRDRLAEGLGRSLQRFSDRFGDIASRGARGLADFGTCAEWALEQAEAAKKSPAPATQ